MEPSHSTICRLISLVVFLISQVLEAVLIWMVLKGADPALH